MRDLSSSATIRRAFNRAAAAMKHVFDPHLQQLDPQLEEDASEPSAE